MCDNVDCANKGCFEGDTCPGSEEELHHCVLCGWLTWDGKSNICDKCVEVHCPCCWQNTFVYMDECEEIEQGGYEWICTPCFRANETLWCTSSDCPCSQKIDIVNSNYEKILKNIQKEANS